MHNKQRPAAHVPVLWHILYLAEGAAGLSTLSRHTLAEFESAVGEEVGLGLVGRMLGLEAVIFRLLRHQIQVL